MSEAKSELNIRVNVAFQGGSATLVVDVPKFSDLIDGDRDLIRDCLTLVGRLSGKDMTVPTSLAIKVAPGTIYDASAKSTVGSSSAPWNQGGEGDKP